MALAILRCLLFVCRLVLVVGCFLFRFSLVCIGSSRCVGLWLFLALMARQCCLFGLAVCCFVFVVVSLWWRFVGTIGRNPLSSAFLSYFSLFIFPFDLICVVAGLQLLV
jgi:hypothetical protein